MAEVKFAGVTKSFGSVEVIPELNLTLPDTEFVVLVGPSGCGKSTTLRLIAGLEQATTGKIYIGDRVVNEVKPKDRDIAMVFQSYALYPHMTVRENLSFGLKLRKVDRKEVEKRVSEVGEILGLTELLDRRPKQLSGGQRQRVAMGRAIVRRPAAFLFDEPLSNLDAKLRGEMRREIARLHQRLKTTMVYVTHDQVEAMTLADRIVAMHRGRVQQVGSPLDLYDRPSNLFVAGFIGTPQMNFIEMRVKKKGGTVRLCADGDSAFDLSLPERFAEPESNRAILGIRPSDLVVDEDVGSREGSSLRATVEVREPMGAEIYLTLASESGPLQARVEGHHPASVGQVASVFVPADKIHLFDPETENTYLADS